MNQKRPRSYYERDRDERQRPQNYTYLVNHPRHEVIAFLPKQAIVAEIGVAEGDFSSLILSLCRTRRLYLIDPWEHQDGGEYRGDPQNVCDSEQKKRYQAVQARFAIETRQGRVSIHRMESSEMTKLFPKRFFDWVYIDAMHSYDAVHADLSTCYELVKDDGFLCGHDYANHSIARSMNFGVVEAVNDFVRETGCYFLVLTCEAYPTYILSKSNNSYRFHALKNAISGRMRSTKVYDFAERRFQQKIILDRSGRPERICTIVW